MPNSERVALVVTEAVVGPQVWQYGACDTMPDEEYERTKLAAVGVLELVARAIDWPRLLADAEQRHRVLHRDTCPEDPRAYLQPMTRDVCGECLREALLAHGYPGHSQDWKTSPTVERRAAYLDWPAVFAVSIRHRSAKDKARLTARRQELEQKQRTSGMS